MKSAHILALFSFLFASACSETDGREGNNAAIEGATCDGFCGDQAPAGCYCDAQCMEEGDCCPDAELVCTFAHACDDDEEEPPPPPDNAACFLGGDGSGTTCFPVVTIDPYTYPTPLNDNYREPIAYFDVESLDLSKKLTPNFKFSEISAAHKGRYQVVQPHAMAKIQRVREQTGALRVNSGFRSPPYNASVGGAKSSRHMFGDAFDVVPQATSQNHLYNVCKDLGAGYVAKYSSGHVHCDWRDDSVDPLFYGSLASTGEPPEYYRIEDVRARVVVDAEVLHVEAEGYDATEGDLLREWTALDADGEALLESTDMSFRPPPGTTLVRVMVGGLVEVEHPL